ncbi:MAG: PolC-type DNA polymerase III [Syntrophomonadaceae bacterium]|nr:PolC-type DNA polymerase III [Syntrophomonadaceae bacterium]
MTLNQLLQRLDCPEEAGLESACIGEITVLQTEKNWRIELILDQLVPAQRLYSIARMIQSRIPEINEVQIVVTPQDAESCLSEIVTGNWLEIVKQVDESEPFLADAKYVVENDHLKILFDEVSQWQKAIQLDLCSRIEGWMVENYCISFLVTVLYTGDLSSRSENPVVPPLNNIVPSQSSLSGRKEFAGGKSKTKGKTIPDVKPTPIIELQEGLQALITGRIVRKDYRQLKNGRSIVLYDVTDYSDTIIVKRFDEDLYEVGNDLKVYGEVRYDSYEKDALFFPTAIESVNITDRRDEASVKRVELHLHTNLSTLDGMTNIGDLMAKVAEFGHQALAITDHGCLQGFPEADKLGKKYGIKIIYGVEAYLVDEQKQDRSHHIVLLAANEIGLRNLYFLTSDSYLNNYYRTPRILRTLLIKHREGLILGSACERGEVFSSILKKTDWEELKLIADFYDYLEIMPLTNNEFLIRDRVLGSREELMAMNQTLIKLGKELRKPVVATGDVHFLNPQDDVFRRIIQAGKGFEDAENQAALYYRTTGEMLEEFDYLGDELAWEVVVKNSNLIADQCSHIRPVPEGFFAPVMEGAADRLTKLTRNRAHVLYGQTLPEYVEDRIAYELNSITQHGFSELYLIAYELVKKSNSDGYLVGSRGSVGSSLVAFLTGITEVNPLAPHYRCKCGYTRFPEDVSVSSGIDLPRDNCPECSQELIRDGFEIPFETFLGIDGDKVPDIDLNFSGDYQSQAHQFVEDLFGKDRVFKAGTISTIGEKTAFGFVKKYEEQFGLKFRKAEIDRLVRGITGIKRTTGQHPGGLMIVPNHMDVHHFTPIQRPADDVKSEITTTHFEYEALSGVLVKIDVLGHDDPTMIKSLEDLTGFKATEISFDEPRTMELFSDVASLGVKPEDIRSQVGTFGIPEFNTRFVRQMLEVTRPKTFSELVRISGLSHGTDVWVNNAHDLIKNEIAGLNEVIAIRDDIMTYLIQKGLEKKESFAIMEKVRKGRAGDLTSEQLNRMREHQVPDWYIDSCMKIQYMFPKAHAVAYVMMAYRIAFYKAYYPLAFYASFFSIRAQDFDDAIISGYDEVRKRLEDIDHQGHSASPKDKNLIPVLEVALEMWARGFNFYPVDLYRSGATKFEIMNDGLLLPFSALPGVGESAANNLAEAREGCKFTSVEDLQRRGRVNKAVIEILDKTGCLQDLPPTDQISLFG